MLLGTKMKISQDQTQSLHEVEFTVQFTQKLFYTYCSYYFKLPIHKIYATLFNNLSLFVF